MTVPAFVFKGDITSPPGFLQGMRHPAVIVPMAVNLADDLPDRLAECEQQFASRVPALEMPAQRRHRSEESAQAAQRMLHWVARLQAEAGWALADSPHARVSDAQPGVLMVMVPCLPLAQPITAKALRWVAGIFNAVAAGQAPDWALLDRLRVHLASHAGATSNMPRFLRAANRMSLPWDRLTSMTYSFGQGARTRWLDSSFTDATPHLSTRFARDKVECAHLMRRAGLPAPVHRLVPDAEAAVRTAATFGYPVVVKPADLDGGVAVAADLRTEDEVRSAYAVARDKSKQVLVERHFEGRDYRLTVFQGKLLWAIERQPGSVTGDGVNTVEALVAIVNQDPRRGDGKQSALKALALDAEADAMLEQHGLTRHSVPEAGRFVKLRRASNVALGGMPVAVMDQVHPDNAALAERAANLLRLDLAGVDLLIPDIGRSWLESGALICEVNAQPSLGQATAAHLYAPLLRRLVQGDGRIPIAVVVGASGPEALGRAVVARLAREGCVAGWAGPAGAAIGEGRIVPYALGSFEAGQVLLTDRRTEAAIVFAQAGDMFAKGLAFDRFDALLAAGAPGSSRKINMLAASCVGAVAEADQVAPEAMEDWLVQQLLAARDRHAAAPEPG
ncbi:MAG: cyanophycin synthetase [Burkholderiales bacterium]|nr:cyanophycin synthetase [Burkholderiales bacterium]